MERIFNINNRITANIISVFRENTDSSFCNVRGECKRVLSACLSNSTYRPFAFNPQTVIKYCRPVKKCALFVFSQDWNKWVFIYEWKIVGQYLCETFIPWIYESYYIENKQRRAIKVCITHIKYKSTNPGGP